MNQNNIIVSNGDYLLMYLQYDKYIEIPCVGFIIKYLKNGTVYEKVINPFMYYKTNNLDEEVIKLTYDSNNY